MRGPSRGVKDLSNSSFIQLKGPTLQAAERTSKYLSLTNIVGVDDPNRPGDDSRRQCFPAVGNFQGGVSQVTLQEPILNRDSRVTWESAFGSSLLAASCFLLEKLSHALLCQQESLSSDPCAEMPYCTVATGRNPSIRGCADLGRLWSENERCSLGRWRTGLISSDG